MTPLRLALLLSPLLLPFALPYLLNANDARYLMLKLTHKFYTLKFTYQPSAPLDHPHHTPADLAIDPQTEALSHMLQLIRNRRPKVDLETVDPLTVFSAERKGFGMGHIAPPQTLYPCTVTERNYTHNGQTVQAFWLTHNARQLRAVERRDGSITQQGDFLLYLHGGAWMSGDVTSYQGFECEFSHRANDIPVLHLELSLVPDAFLPAMIDEVMALWGALGEQDPTFNQRAHVSGDSAGGAILHLFTQRLVKQQLPLPQSIVSISAFLDFAKPPAVNAPFDVILTPERSKWNALSAMGMKEHVAEHDIQYDDPAYSALYGSFESYPPTYLVAGTSEIHYGDSVRAAKNLKAAGVEYQTDLVHHQQHDFPLFYRFIDEADAALTRMAQWISNHSSVSTTYGHDAAVKHVETQRLGEHGSTVPSSIRLDLPADTFDEL